MNLLDEDLDTHQRHELEALKIRFRQIGVEIGHSGMKDLNDVIPMLHHLKSPTFFTLDHGFYHPKLRHQNYCLVYLDVWNHEAAKYIRRFLRHEAFRTQAQRMGRVVRIRHSGLSWWEVNARAEHVLSW